jgi:heme exporter protein A
MNPILSVAEPLPPRSRTRVKHASPDQVMRSSAPSATVRPATAGAAISLVGIARRFDRTWPLRAVNLEVAPGDGVALMGKNGSGKTTLLRVIATALRPNRGGGRVMGHDLISDADSVRGQVGLLGYQPGLYPDLTARENLAFALRMLGRTADRQVIDRVLDRVAMLPRADDRVRFFSSGMTRRVALARLLLRDHAVLLLDEPHASFDAEGLALVDDICVEARARGAAVVIATHDPVRSRAVANRACEIRDGILVEVDWAHEAIGTGMGSK